MTSGTSHQVRCFTSVPCNFVRTSETLGIPHSLQATNESAEGSEFLLVFDDGAFRSVSNILCT